MNDFLAVAVFALTTAVAIGAAALLQAFFLRRILSLMRPAGAVRPVTPPIERGTQLLVHAFARRG